MLNTMLYIFIILHVWYSCICNVTLYDTVLADMYYVPLTSSQTVLPPVALSFQLQYRLQLLLKAT